MYIAGQLETLNETLLETLCLIQGLGHLGFGEGQVGVLVWRADAQQAGAALLKPQVKEGDHVVAVRLSARAEMKYSTEVSLEHDIVWHGVVGSIPPWPEDEFRQRWIEAAQIFLDAPAAEGEPVWERSRSRGILPQLEIVLRSKGFQVKK